MQTMTGPKDVYSTYNRAMKHLGDLGALFRNQPIALQFLEGFDCVLALFGLEGPPTRAKSGAMALAGCHGSAPHTTTDI